MSSSNNRNLFMPISQRWHHFALVYQVVEPQLDAVRQNRSIAVLRKLVKLSGLTNTLSYRVCGQLARLMRRYCSFERYKDHITTTTGIYADLIESYPRFVNDLERAYSRKQRMRMITD
jgi:hypothetical protein